MAATLCAQARERGGAFFNCSCAHSWGVSMPSVSVTVAASDERLMWLDLLGCFARRVVR